MRGRNFDRVLIYISCTVTVVWGVSIMAHTFLPSHPSVPDSVQGVMVIVATALFGAGLSFNARKNGKDGE